MRIHKEGAAWSASARGAGLAGATADNPRTGRPSQGPHGIQVAYRVSPGTTGMVHVLFGGDASLGIMIAGDLLGRPVPLPLSRCSLLVDPRGVLHAFLLNRAGEATVAFPIPRMQGVDINFQAIALDLGAGRTAALVATNGQHLGCR